MTIRFTEYGHGIGSSQREPEPWKSPAPPDMGGARAGRRPVAQRSRQPQATRLLTVVEPAVEDIVEGADGNRRLGRQGDALVGDVTVVSLAWCRVRRHGDGRRRAWRGPAGPEFQLRSGRGGARSRPWAKNPISDHTESLMSKRRRRSLRACIPRSK